MTLADLERFLQQRPDILEAGRPASDATINRAESYLGVRFPEEYRQFLKHWGHLAIGPSEFYGLTGDEFEVSSVPNAIWYTKELRHQIGLPKEYVVLYNNNGDEFHLLDTSDPKGRVVVWDVPSGRVVSIKAPSLFDYILKEAQDFAESEADT